MASLRQPRPRWPDLARINGHGDAGALQHGVEKIDTGFVTGRIAWRAARSFRKYHDGSALCVGIESGDTQRPRSLEAVLAIDANMSKPSQDPSEQRNLQQLPLQDDDRVLQDILQDEGFEPRLVFCGNEHGPGREAGITIHMPADTQDSPEEEENEGEIGSDDGEKPMSRKYQRRKKKAVARSRDRHGEPERGMANAREQLAHWATQATGRRSGCGAGAS